MNAVKQAGWLFIALILIACSSWYFANKQQVPKLDNRSLSLIPDAIVSTVVVRQFGNDGKLINAFQAKELRHIPRDNIHYCTSPYILVSQGEQPAWEIRAEQATALNGGEKITLQNKVKITQGAGPHNLSSTLMTESLDYYPKTKFATTLNPVTFAQPGTIVQSQGMNAYLDEKRVVLLNQAKATYEPKQHA